MAKSSTQSQSSNQSKGATKKIAKKSPAKKATPLDKKNQARIKQALDSQIKTKTMDFWDKQFTKGNKLLKVSPKVGKLEQQCREDLALCYRIAHLEGLNEGTDNHFSIMLNVEGYQSLLTLPHGILWCTAKPEDFILVDMEGEILRPSGRKDKPGHGKYWVPDISAIKIHGKIHAGLGEGRAKAVFHTHQPFTAVLCAAKPGDDELQMVHQNCCRFYKQVIYNREFNGIVNNDVEGISLRDQFLKKKNEKGSVMLLRNHGIITIGKSAAHAMLETYYFEKCARMQVELKMMGQNLKNCIIPDGIAKGVKEYYNREHDRMSLALFNAWKTGGV